MSHQQILADLEKRQIRKRILAAGVRQREIPDFVNGGKVTFHYRTCLVNDEKTVLDDSKILGKPMELIFGKKFKLEVWETLLKTMRVEEVAEFLVADLKETAVYPMVAKSLRDIFKGKKHRHNASQHCCGMMLDGEGTGYEDLNQLLKKPQPLLFVLELLKYETPEEFKKETWTMTTQEKIELIPKLKEEGNLLYKEKRISEAAEKYETALGLLEQLAIMEKPGDKDWIELDKMKIPFLLNYAQCKLLEGDFYSVITHTTSVLEKNYASESECIKALFRRGKAHAAVWDLKEAREDLSRAAQMDPTVAKSAALEIKALEDKVQKQEEHEKASLQGLF